MSVLESRSKILSGDLMVLFIAQNPELVAPSQVSFCVNFSSILLVGFRGVRRRTEEEHM